MIEAELVLTEEERQWCWAAAKRRDKRRRPHNPGTNLSGVVQRYQPVEIHYVGLLGEMAFALYHGIPRGEIQVLDGHGDPGIDFEVDGVTWQVKTTRRQPPALLLGPKEKRRAERYALVAYHHPRTMHLIGHASREELVSAPTITIGDRDVRRLGGGALAPFGPAAVSEWPVEAAREIGRPPAPQSANPPVEDDIELAPTAAEDALPDEAVWPAWWEEHLLRMLEKSGAKIS